VCYEEEDEVDEEGEEKQTFFASSRSDLNNENMTQMS
jgi:hypothetical protein